MVLNLWSISAKNRKLNLTFSPCKMNSKWDNNLFNNWFWPFIFSFFSFFKSLWSCLRSCHFGYNTFFPFFLLPLFIAFLKSFYVIMYQIMKPNKAILKKKMTGKKTFCRVSTVKSQIETHFGETYRQPKQTLLLSESHWE